MDISTSPKPGPSRRQWLAPITPARLLAWGALAAMLALTLLPLWFALKTALMHPANLYEQSSSLLPSDVTLLNFKRVLGLMSAQESQALGGSGAEINFLRALGNSVLFTAIVVVLQVSFAAMAAYAFVCDDFSMKLAAERILFVKYLNAGQICTTVDHAWLPQQRIAEFVQLAQTIVPQRYPSLASPDYTSIIDERAFDRLLHALDDARERGATLVQLLPGPAFDRPTRKIAPHIVLNAPDDSVLLQREIFGPILPLRGYSSLDSVIDRINAGPRPLAIYPFSNDGQRVQTLLERVMSGGVSVNDALFHVGQHDLPFGGVGDSGMGHYHGHEGFHTFSKLRPVFYQTRFSSLKFLWPPYGKFADRVLAFLTR